MSRPPNGRQEGPASAEVVHLLSFDVEEYFQAEAASQGVSVDDWGTLPKRLDPVVGRILDLLAARRMSATFFVLGWVARHERGLVQRIAAAGHEIASHGNRHAMLDRLTPEGFRQDLRESRALLEDIAGCPVIGYRAPTFSIGHQTAWALDVLAEEGFQYDSSVFPIHHDRYGVPDAPARVHRAVGPGGGSLIEIPPLTVRLAGSNWPVGGGGYLRVVPVRLVGRAIRAAGRSGTAAMIYLHPWELDPGQPLLPMGRLSRFRHRVGLQRTAGKLAWLLERFHFGGIRDRLDALRAAATCTHTYGGPA